jgi:peptidoglycan hydrolase-like protein with peptidoglycan-binding domain
VRDAVYDIDDEGADKRGGRRQWAIAFLGFLLRRPRDTLAVATALAALATILVNALFLQPDPHPAPLFSLKAKRSAVARDSTGAVMLPRPRPGDLSVRAAPAVQPAPAARVEAPPRAAPPRSRSEIITDVQRELARRGFYDGPADGIHGSKTDAAIRKFEKKAGLPLTGEPSEALLKTMVQTPADGARGPSPSAGKPRIDPIAALLPRLEQSPTQQRSASSGGNADSIAAVPRAEPFAAAPRAEPIAALPRSNPGGTPPQSDQSAQAPSKLVKAVQQALADFGYGQVKPTGISDVDTRAAIEAFETTHKLPVTGQISDRFLHELAAVTGRPIE